MCSWSDKYLQAFPLSIDLLRYEYNGRNHQQAAAWALGELGDSRAVAPLLDVIDRVGVAEAALAALGRIGSTDAVPALLDRLGDIRWYPALTCAAQTLGDLADPRAAAALAGFVRDADMRFDVRRAAVIALGRITDPAVIEPLVEALGDSDDVIAQTAAEALGRRHDAFPRLLQALRASDGATRGGACYALGVLHDSPATDQLARILAVDPDPVVRRAAATALGRIERPESEKALLGSLADAEVGDAAASALAGLSVPPTRELIALLGEGVATQRRVAAIALGQLAAFGFIDELLNSLHDDNPDVRAAVIDALGRQRPERAMHPLIAVLRDEEERGSLRARAARALGAIGGPKAVGALLDALSDDVEAARLRAAEALGRLGDERAVPALSEVVRRDHNLEVRSVSVEALGAIGRAAAAALISLLDDNAGGLRIDVIRSLGRCGEGSAANALARFISDDNRIGCLAVVQALAMLRDPRSIEPLKRALALPWTYSEIHEAALEGLSLLDDRQAIEAVLDYYINRFGSHYAARRALNIIASRRLNLSWMK